MLFSFNELKRLANLPQNLNPKDIADAITEMGFEVEEIKPFTDIEGIKFGKVLEIKKNPNADKLNVCSIEFSDTSRTIQTNADNLKVNDIVIAFVPGARVGKVVFDVKELKGVISEGMLSSSTELGIDKELCRSEVVSGIATYNNVTDLSIDPIKYLGLDDFIIDVDILSNRSDANSYYVMALELVAKFSTQISLPEIKEGNLKTDIKIVGDELVMIEAENNFNITIQEQIFLNKHGIKSVNDAADLTNLSLIYSGQPTHAYDASTVGKNFSVQKCSDKITIFGNKEVELSDDIVIYSDKEAVSVASVIGIEKFATTQTTKRIILELGIFNIKDVRRAVKSVKLNSLASSQGSKKLNRGTTRLALMYLTNRLTTFSLPINMPKLEKQIVQYDKKQINRLAGFEIFRDHKYDDAIKSLTTLGFDISESQVKVPLYRHDFENSADLAEEIFRFYGYENFKPQSMSVTPSPISIVNNPVGSFIAQGYQEVVTYTLISEDKNKINPFNFEAPIKLETFVSKEREVVRDSQAYSLLEIADYNIKRGMKSISLVSSGMINDGKKTIALLSNTKDLKTIQHEIINIIPNVSFERLSISELHPGVSAKILVDNMMIGWIGKVHPSVTKVDAYIAEISHNAFKRTEKSFNEYNDQPLKFEDITIPLAEHEDLGTKLEAYQAYDVRVIDKYQDGDILKVTIRVTK